MNKKFEEAKEYFNKGKFYLEKLDFKEAEKFFFLSLKILPDRKSSIKSLIYLYGITENLNSLAELLNKYQHIKDQNTLKFGFAYKEFLSKNYSKCVSICEGLLINCELEDKVYILTIFADSYFALRKFFQALKIYKLIFFIKKDFYVYYRIGLVLLKLGKAKNSYKYLYKSHRLNPQNFFCLWDMSLALLTMGELKKGFEYYENRWKIPSEHKKKFQEIDELKNIKNIKKKKIVVWYEQGLGDTIHFFRFVIKLSNYCENVFFLVPSKLKKILSFIGNKIKIISENNIEKNNYFDFQISLWSLPKILNIKSTKEINFEKLKLIKNQSISTDIIRKKEFNIGLCWSGDSTFAEDEFRSLPLDFLSDILKLKSINFYKLSKGLKLSEKKIYSNYNILDLGEKDFYELSHFLYELDFVISTDTVMIHLCGVLGIKATLLLNYNADWRWFFDDKTTVWYPSIEILRCKKINEWKPVLEKLKTKIIEAQKIKFNNS